MNLPLHPPIYFYYYIQEYQNQAEFQNIFLAI
jgi:hypothetical protein